VEKKLLNPVQVFRLDQRRKRFLGGVFYLRIGLVLFLLTMPFLFHSFEVLDVVLKIVIFSTLVASYDILIGYTGVASLGHTMYFGIGAYWVGIFLGKLGLSSYGYVA
jgi:branched-chain amino acid transport system permease protein